MEIALERIEFDNEEVHIEGENRVRIIPGYVDVEYAAKIGKEWLEGELRGIPYNYYVNLGHKGLIEKIKERLQEEGGG